MQNGVCQLPPQCQRQLDNAHDASSWLSMAHERLRTSEVQRRSARGAALQQHSGCGSHLNGIAQRGACGGGVEVWMKL